jgi:Spy/CpxP family protein refolding chaperone
MNPKKTILLTVCGLTLLSGLLIAAADVATAPSTPSAPPAPAAAGGADEKMREAFRERLIEKLGLSADQQKKFDDLRAQEHKELDALKADPTLAPDARREKGRAVVENYRGQMRALLTPEQLKKADEWREQSNRRMEQRGFSRDQDRRPPAPHQAMGPMQNPLAIVAMGERIKDRMAERLQLTDEQRDKLEHLGRAYRAQQRELARKHLEEMRAVLTPEQQEKAKQLMHHPGRGPGGPEGHRVGESAPEGMGPLVAGPDFGPGGPADDADEAPQPDSE